jgi:cellulose 1,4-beta-cellobiosidase
MSMQYDGALIPVDGADKDYYVQTNWWYLYKGQTVAVNGLSYTLGNPAGARSDGNMPMGYPSFFIGSYSGHTTRGSNLPKQVSALSKVPTTLATNASSMGTSNYNAAYDVWLTASGSPLSNYQFGPGAGGAYLMVWLFMPSDRQPRGAFAYRSQKVDGLPGTWDVWIDNSDPACISYVSTTPLARLDFDLNDVIQDAVKNSYGVTSSMYLSIVFGGFEVWGGGDGLRLEAFCANVR